MRLLQHFREPDLFTHILRTANDIEWLSPLLVPDIVIAPYSFLAGACHDLHQSVVGSMLANPSKILSK